LDHTHQLEVGVVEMKLDSQMVDLAVQVEEEPI
jgi:hypothetical protein